MAVLTANECMVLYPKTVMDCKVALNVGMCLSVLGFLNKYGFTGLNDIHPMGDECFGP